MNFYTKVLDETGVCNPLKRLQLIGYRFERLYVVRCVANLGENRKFTVLLNNQTSQYTCRCTILKHLRMRCKWSYLSLVKVISFHEPTTFDQKTWREETLTLKMSHLFHCHHFIGITVDSCVDNSKLALSYKRRKSFIMIIMAMTP